MELQFSFLKGYILLKVFELLFCEIMTSQYDFDEEKKILWFDVFGLVIMFDLSFLLQYITVH